MCELCIDTDVISEAAELQLCLLFVQVGQLLVALDGPGLCNATCHLMLVTSNVLPAHVPGSHSPQAPIQPSESVSVAHQGRWCPTLVHAWYR